ncbi:thiamine biosynthesis lipoprotein [bacterium A37T11]|nr:thiamine biosynthesis lipoprotein [bacterium A37T11]
MVEEWIRAKLKWLGLSLIILVGFLNSSFTLGEHLNTYKISGYAQGTNYTIKYYALDSLVKRGQVDSVLNVLDQSMSIYKPQSLISQFNQAPGELIIDEHFSKVIKRSFTINRDSQGLFDITVGPLVSAWGFGVKHPAAGPDSVRIHQLLGCTGMQYLHLDKYVLKKSKPCLQLDVNGIAQGYSVDVLAELLTDKGITCYLIELGGELRIKGPKPTGKSFSVGIEGPAKSANSTPVIRHVIGLNNGALTTSGNYRKYAEMNGKRYSHLINPITGYPMDTGMISATIYAQDAITADGYDNVLMGMDAGHALAFMENHKNMEAYLIYRDKNGVIADTMTRGFRKLIIQ